MKPGMILQAGTACTLWLSACGDWASPDLERMLEQRSYRAYEENPRFDDHRAMRPPPEGTIPLARPLEAPDQLPGMAAGRYLSTFPKPIGAAQMQRGQNRYNIFCAVCHGADGHGVTPVAHNMTYRKPPSLVDERVRVYAPGRIYNVITQGYGLMPAYAHQLPPEDRWAVAAYVRALGISQYSRLEDLPDDLQVDAKANLP